MHCQQNWLKLQQPRVVAWPWENHPWERDLVRSAKRLGIRTIGYQHAVVGRHQFNFSPCSNFDGLDSIPDVIACNGPGYRGQLQQLGIPAKRLIIGGAFRVQRITDGKVDSMGPHYVALSAIPGIAQNMMEAIKPLAAKGLRFIVKDHPLYPFKINESANLRRTSKTIPEVTGIASILYATGTPGLEGLFGGIPTFRLMMDDGIALDIMPPGVSAEATTDEGLLEALQNPNIKSPVAWEEVMAPVPFSVWQKLFEAD